MKCHTRPSVTIFPNNRPRFLDFGAFYPYAARTKSIRTPEPPQSAVFPLAKTADSPSLPTMPAVSLHSRDFAGEGCPLLILHGMLGSSRNWATAAQALAEHFRVYALDLRNHGDSPHVNHASYAEMAADVRAWCEANEVARPVLLGHSLGGKVAMTLAAQTPDFVRSLVLADIAPRDYAPHFAEDIALLRSLDLASITSRQEAENRLAENIPDFAFRRFLLTNLERDRDTKAFRWQCNLEAIWTHLEEWSRNPMIRDDQPHAYEEFTLAIRGGRSDFVRDEDLPAFEKHFPDYVLETLPDSGHNVHFDDRDAFVTALLKQKEKLCG